MIDEACETVIRADRGSQNGRVPIAVSSALPEAGW
jgi:hypothetical protein